MRSIWFLAFAALTLNVVVPNTYSQTLTGGSIPTGAITPEPLGLSLANAIDRGLQYNLAVLSGTQDERTAAAVHLRALYELYPKVGANLSSAQEQINLAAFGFSGFPGQSQIVGPFALIDARARFTQSVYDRKLIEDLREAQENQKAVSYGNQNTRELVVLTVANLYLQALAGSSRVTSTEAQVARAQALFSRAQDLKNSGLVPGIDVIRAQVELQTQQQRLLAYRNDFAIEKLNLVRAIGIPLGQQITLLDHMPSVTPAAVTLDTALQSARENRADVKRADSLVQAAQRSIASARSESRPTLEFAADYGTIGRTPTQNHGTYSLIGTIHIPIFNDNQSRSDLDAALARAEQRRLETEDLKARAEMEVRAAFLDLQSAAEQARVAQNSLDLAHQQLDQAQDRFVAGVTTNLEVVQAQEAVAVSDENVISSLYALNVAKARLARAMGTAEQTIKTFLGGTP
jgi:outer membrane protein TolC